MCVVPIRNSAVFVVVLLVTAINSFSQVQGGGSVSSGGIGKAYEAAGKSAAARELQRRIDGGLLKSAVARSKGGRPKTAQLRPSSSSPQVPGRPAAIPSNSNTPAFTEFTPARNTGFETTFANSIGGTEQEKEFIRQVVGATKTAFEQEVSAKGRPNNLAAAMTFFVATMATVYHNDPEPSDAAIDKLWDGLNETLNELPGVAGMTDAEKQIMYDTLVAYSGLVLTGHLVAQQTGDADTRKIYKALAGVLIQTVLKTDPEKLRFTSTGLIVGG
ncbi:MAG: hypothetical protein KIT61_03590 [Pyrinomonadaceae bacterium]|nr:hypothetical protein [Pyrinomonadaceae bacterium]